MSFWEQLLHLLLVVGVVDQENSRLVLEQVMVQTSDFANAASTRPVDPRDKLLHGSVRALITPVDLNGCLEVRETSLETAPKEAS